MTNKVIVNLKGAKRLKIPSLSLKKIMHKIKTFEGESISISEMTHQHMSNWLWFHKIFWGIDEEFRYKDLISHIKKRIKEEFNGKVLLYRPIFEFNAEIEMLESKGMLKSNGVIKLNGKIIGHVNTRKKYIASKVLENYEPDVVPF